jgi:hypothetical protein
MAISGHQKSRRNIPPIILNAKWHFYGQIGTSKFTEPAANTVLAPHNYGFPHIVERQDALRAESNAHAAPLAPLTINQEVS